MFELLAMLPGPQARHAMSVHFPIALAVAGLLPLILAACGAFRSTSLRAIALTFLLLTAAGAFVAAQTGSQAANAVRLEQGPLSETEEALLIRHERRGRIAWIWPLVPAALLAATWTRRRTQRIAAGSLALATGIAAAGWILTIGQVGGKLVYEHGLGTPQRDPYVSSQPAEPGRADVDPSQH